MRPRCVELERVLKKTGSFYYHCDWHASHYVKVMLDQIFGENNFQNEIVWKRTSAHSSSRRYGPVHDVIFYYTGSPEYTWNQQYQPYDDAYLSANYSNQARGQTQVLPHSDSFWSRKPRSPAGSTLTMFVWRFVHVATEPGCDGAAAASCFGSVGVPSGAPAGHSTVHAGSLANAHRVSPSATPTGRPN